MDRTHDLEGTEIRQCRLLRGPSFVSFCCESHTSSGCCGRVCLERLFLAPPIASSMGSDSCGCTSHIWQVQLSALKCSKGIPTPCISSSPVQIHKQVSSLDLVRWLVWKS